MVGCCLPVAHPRSFVTCPAGSHVGRCVSGDWVGLFIGLPECESTAAL